jgi:hypothetical protein
MMKTVINVILLTVMMFFSANAVGQVPVAVLPFEGDPNDKGILEMRIKEFFIKNGIAVITDASLKEIMKIHEQAQSLGSAYHDISRLKVAEYLVKGGVSMGKANIVVVDVNSATEIYNTVVAMTGDRDYAARKAAKELHNAIIMHSSSRQRELPSEAAPYMEVVTNLVSSLGMGDAASYPYLAFYYNGRYKRPADKDMDRTEKARLFLQVIRPNMLRSKLTYMGMEAKSPWVYISIIADKLGKKTKHKFGIIELDDGSLAVGLYELLQ